MPHKIITYLTPIAYALAIGCADGPGAQNTASDIEALTSALSGEFDSGQQMREDAFNKVDKKDKHFWVNRIFVDPDTPKMPNPVLVGSTRYGPPWTFDDNEFLVWSFSPDPDSPGILMSPQRFKDLEARKPHARDAEKLSGFGPDDLVPAISGASCDIIWTRSETGFAGRTKPCAVMSTTHKKLLDWEWGYSLTPDALYIEFSGKDENGKTLDGTPEGKPYRLDRVEGGAEYANGRSILFNPTKRADIAEAIKLLEQAVAENPDHASSKIALIYAHIKQNKYANAQTVVQNLKEQKNSLSEADALWLEALEARIADDYGREISAWKNVLKQDPQNRWASYEMASIFYRTGDYPQTVEAIENILQMEPDEDKWGASYIYYLHSKALYRMGKHAEAVVAAEPGVRNEATRRATYYRKAMAQLAAGELSDATDALATYHDYSKRNGSVNEANFNANVALFFFELGDYDKAVESARAGYDLAKGQYQYWTLGYAMTEQGRPAEGLEVIEAGLVEFPESVNLLAGKGWAHYRLGEMEQADAALRAAQAASKRKNSGVERDVKIVAEAFNNPDAKPVPPVRWFGD